MPGGIADNLAGSGAGAQRVLCKDKLNRESVHLVIRVVVFFV
jgi:hypothetical protein